MQIMGVLISKHMLAIERGWLSVGNPVLLLLNHYNVLYVERVA